MRFSLLLLFGFLCLSMFSQTIDVTSAKRIVDMYFNETNNSVEKVANNYCVFSRDQDRGYIIVCSDKEGHMRIVGYSNNGSWDEKRMPKQLLEYLRIIDVSKNWIKHNKPFSQHINDDGKKDIPILLSTKWHQNAPYNDMSPIVIDGNMKSLAGCVAIAASQIVYYWHKDNPSSTYYDTPTYSYGKAPVTYSVPAGTEYRWDLIRNEYTGEESEEEENAVANLTYIVGTSAWLQYSATGTGGHINDVIIPFSSQFRLSGRYYVKSNYSQEEWEGLLYESLCRQQPILYSGSSEVGGHAVVIDGYDAKLNLFHFNFGWGGDGDGYYTVDDITGMNGYNNSQSCVADIFPQERNLKISDNSPDIIQRRIQTEFSLTIRNSSTLDIEEINYFICGIKEEEPYKLEKEHALFSMSKKIPNNGTEFRLSIGINADVNAGDYNLILTDENLRILKKKEIKIIDNTAIYGVKNDESCELVLRKNGCNTLLIETKTPTIITIYTVDGKKIFSNIINGKFERVLPKGLYIINNILWLQ